MSSKEFGDELLAGASQVDPQAMAQFREELSQIDLSPEELDSLNNMVDEVIASPEQYDALREKYSKMGMPEELLPEQFDGQFFAALNMAIDQLIAEPAGVQAFAQGGIAELKPIAKAIAGYGRNGDTMLAHITPAEARMLRRRGGSGTTNPATGLPEFFLKKAFKSLGNAVKKFTSSTVGRLVTGLAVGFFLGPAAVAALGATAGTVTAAAITGFTASASSSLLAGDGLKNALKQGVVGAASAGAIQGIGSAVSPGFSLTGQAPASGVNPTTMEALTGQYNKVFGPTGAYNTPIAPTEFATQADLAAAGPAPTGPSGAGSTAYKAPTIGESFSKMGEGLGLGKGPASFDTFTQGVGDLLSPGPNNAQITSRAQEIMRTTPGASLKDAMAAAAKELSPDILRTYGPATLAGIGAIGAFGGFKSTPADASEMKSEMMKPATQRIAEKGQQKQYYIQNIPGVKYDEFGAPIYGQYNPLPTAPASTTPTSNFNLPSTIGGIGSLYTPPLNTMGAQKPVAQPYNTASMYTNLMPPPPPQYAEGGDVRPSAESAAMIEAQRAAMIAQAQALGQSGYTPTNPGRYGVERGSYTPSTGFAEFTQQYKQNNPAPVSAVSTSVPTSAPTSPPPTGGTGTAAPTVAATSAPTTIIDYAQQQLDNNYLSRINPVQLPVDNFQTSMGGYQPPIDYAQQQLDDNFLSRANVSQLPMDSFQSSVAPPIDYAQQQLDNNYQSPMAAYEPPMAAYEPPMAAYEPPMAAYEPPMAAYEPPMAAYESPMAAYESPMAAYEPPMAAYEQPPMAAYEPPMAAYEQPPMAAYEPPMAAYEPPMAAYEPPMAAYESPMAAYEFPMAAYQQPPMAAYEQPPMAAYEPTVYEQPSYAPPAYNFGGDFDFDNGNFMSSYNTGGIASLRSGGYPRRTGQINGPGTATSDSIPAMLSDGEFVMTAKAVRGAGKGDRRAGAKRMYALMNQLEQNASRG